MKDIIERLKGTRPTAAAEGFATGYELGKTWAGEKATIDELERLAKFAEQRNAFETSRVPGRYFASELMAFAILGDSDKNRTKSDKFWNRIAGLDMAPSDGVALGFARGALGVWNAVKEKVLC